MTKVDIECVQCGSNEYQLLDPKTGEVLCPYCRNRWIVLELVRKTETEKFLAEQAKQPRVIMDNTTETDKKLMDMFLGIGKGALGGLINRVLSIITLLLAIGLIGFVLFLVSRCS